MESFLEKTAAFIKNNPHASKNINVVLPTKRSCIELKSRLEGLDNILLNTIDDFVLQLSPLKLVENIELTLHIKSIFSKRIPENEMPYLITWLPTLIEDFNSIDKNLVDARSLLQYLSDVKNIAHWNIDEQDMSMYIKDDLEFWESLQHIYKEVQTELKTHNKAYEGMIYRYVADHITELIPESNFYIFAGLNRLSKSEEKIIGFLLKNNQADILWDTDQFYMNNASEHPAGYYFKQYKKWLYLDNWKWEDRQLSESEKEIYAIQNNNATMQAQTVRTLLKNWGGEAKTAIILPDENLLPSLLQVMQDIPINLSIGISLKNSLFYTFVQVIFEIQHQIKKEKIVKTHTDLFGDKSSKEIYVDQIYYQSIIDMISHPLFQLYESHLSNKQNPISFSTCLIQFLHSINQIYISQKELDQLPRNLASFCIKKFNWTDEESLIEQFKPFQKLLRLAFGNWRGQVLQSLNNIENCFSIFQEADLFQDEISQKQAEIFSRILSELKTIIQFNTSLVDMRTYKMFLFQMLKEEKVHFNPTLRNNIHVLGLLETRALDFEHVILLSANEGTLPYKKKHRSLLPFEAAIAHDLPTYKDQDRTGSYYFYRLLQRAQKAAILYVRPSDTYGGEEMSRYIHQIAYDLAVKNPQLQFRHINASLSLAQDQKETTLEIPKTEAVLEQIREHLKSGLSPSDIESFIKCSLQYYFKKIAALKEDNGIDEEIGADQFGTIVHDSLEEIFKVLAVKEIYAVDLKNHFSKAESIVYHKFKEKNSSFKGKGYPYIAFKMATKFVKDFLLQQIQELESQTTPLHIIALESQSLTESFNSNFKNTFFTLDYQGHPLTVNIKGIIDRIDRIGSTLRIIDYKTGLVLPSQLKLKEDEKKHFTEDEHFGKARQLWIYLYIVLKNSGEELKAKDINTIQSGIYSLRNLSSGLQLLDTPGFPQIIDDESIKKFIIQTENYLSQIIVNLLDTELTFKKTNDLSTCAWCDFKNICSR